MTAEPPIRISRKGWRRYFPAHPEEVQIAIKAATAEARGKVWHSVEALVDFVGEAVQSQVGGHVVVRVVADDIESGLPTLAIKAGPNPPMHVHIAKTEVRTHEPLPLISDQTRHLLERAARTAQEYPTAPKPAAPKAPAQPAQKPAQPVAKAPAGYAPKPDAPKPAAKPAPRKP